MFFFFNLKSEAWKVGDQRDIFNLQRLDFKKEAIALTKAGLERGGSGERSLEERKR